MYGIVTFFTSIIYYVELSRQKLRLHVLGSNYIKEYYLALEKFEDSLKKMHITTLILLSFALYFILVWILRILMKILKNACIIYIYSKHRLKSANQRKRAQN